RRTGDTEDFADLAVAEPFGAQIQALALKRRKSVHLPMQPDHAFLLDQEFFRITLCHGHAAEALPVFRAGIFNVLSRLNLVERKVVCHPKNPSPQIVFAALSTKVAK